MTSGPTIWQIGSDYGLPYAPVPLSQLTIGPGELDKRLARLQILADSRHVPWADPLRRTFAIDILACPNCGGRLRLAATIEEQTVIIVRGWSVGFGVPRCHIARSRQADLPI